MALARGRPKTKLRKKRTAKTASPEGAAPVGPRANLNGDANLISAILDAAKDLLVVVLDPRGRIVHFNRACQRSTGYSSKEVRGRYVWDFLIPAEETKSVRRVFRELAAGIPNQHENDWVSKDGTRLRIHWSNYVVKRGGAAGKVESVVATGIDITDRTKSALELSEYREQLAAEVTALGRLRTASQRLWRLHDMNAGLEEMIDAGMALMGAQLGTVQLWNPHKRVLEMAGQRGFGPGFLKAFREVPASVGTSCARSFRARKQIVIEDVKLDKSYGPYRTAAAAAGFRAVQATPLLGASGQVVGIFCTYFPQPHRPSDAELRRFDLYAQQAAEFIERVRAEEQLRHSEATIHALLETAAQAVLAHDENGRIVLANAAAEKMFGVPAGRLHGRLLESLIPEPYRKRHVRHRASWFARSHTRPIGVGFDLAGLRSDGAEFPIEVSLSAINSPNGKLGVSFITDITERKRNEQALRAYHDQLQKLSGALLSAQEAGNQAIARELHDVFSQDLAAIGLELSALKEKLGGDPKTSARLVMLHDRIRRLSEDVHRTSRELHPAVLDELGLGPALEHECESFRERSGIPFRFSSRVDTSTIPRDVALCLYRVAQEALRNVHKHSGGASKVTVTLTAAGKDVTLRVTDAGDGFDLEQALKKGGLGLISMEERVRLVHGKLTIRNKPGEGTVVTAVVPR